MNIFFGMLKLFHDLESKLAYKLVHFFRSIRGFETDATVNDIAVMYDSPHFLVVNKRYDVLINHADKGVSVTVEKQLERLYPDLVNPKLAMSFYFCHRLDFSTSGILCIAKHKKACSSAMDTFSSRQSQKYYLAIVRGHISENFITVDEGIGEDTRESFRNIRMALASSQFCTSKWRNATTHIAVLEHGYSHDYPASKILLKPITGRRHQLRLHCNHIGHTIVGDYTYSNRKDIVPYRMFLHAYKLVLPNKIELLDITTEDPFSEQDCRNRWITKEYVSNICNAIKMLGSLTNKNETSH